VEKARRTNHRRFIVDIQLMELLERIAKSHENMEKALRELVGYQGMLHEKTLVEIEIMRMQMGRNPRAIDARYLAGRWPRRDGDSYGTPAAAQPQDGRSEHNPTGPLRTTE
jgi:hypothetical protein